MVEHRAFGHLALVGTHVVLNLMEYGQRDAEETEKEEDGHKPIRTNKSTGKGSIQVLFQTFSKVNFVSQLFTTFTYFNQKCFVQVAVSLKPSGSLNYYLHFIKKNIQMFSFFPEEADVSSKL